MMLTPCHPKSASGTLQNASRALASAGGVLGVFPEASEHSQKRGTAPSGRDFPVLFLRSNYDAG